MRGIRTVVFLLGGIVVSIGDSNAAFSIAKSNELEAEIAASSLSEHVVISKAPVQIEGPDSTVVELLNLVPGHGKRPRARLAGCDCNRACASISLGVIGESEVLRQILPGRKPLYVEKCGNSERRSLTIVFGNDDELVPLFVHREINKAKISSELPFRSSFGDLVTLMGGFSCIASHRNATLGSFDGSLHVAGLSIGSPLESFELLSSAGAGFAYESSGSVPKSDRRQEQQELSRFNTIKLGSVAVSAALLWLAGWLYHAGWSIVGVALAVYSLGGALWRIDLWSLIVR